ncbi:hypothetical protein M9H77_23234 [Catharanthus roseus]|uniref:Uncharacterized protein n=1 Tax=Catharanthus roseus TaxID=4058 RepID=A0ACC0AT47_CATRO|nr:hypothetical protein M9H77_23234 [Catharanthus roseus]
MVGGLALCPCCPTCLDIKNPTQSLCVCDAASQRLLERLGQALPVEVKTVLNFVSTVVQPFLAPLTTSLGPSFQVLVIRLLLLINYSNHSLDLPEYGCLQWFNLFLLLLQLLLDLHLKSLVVLLCPHSSLSIGRIGTITFLNNIFNPLTFSSTVRCSILCYFFLKERTSYKHIESHFQALGFWIITDNHKGGSLFRDIFQLKQWRAKRVVDSHSASHDELLIQKT